MWPSIANDISNTRTRVRKRWSPDQRRAQLLDCAIRALAEHGISRATHSHVAVLAGVSKPTVHSYFRTRQDLVNETLAKVDRHLWVMVSRVLARSDDTLAALTELAYRFAHDARHNPDIIKVWLDWSTGVDNDAWSAYLDLLDRLHREVAASIRKSRRAGLLDADLDVEAAARVYIGGGHTIALMQFAGVKDKQMHSFIERMVRGALGR